MKYKILFGIIAATFIFALAAKGERPDAVKSIRSGKITHYQVQGKAIVPGLINYQGYLTDTGGNPITDTLDMSFSIWDDSTNGSQLWSETQSSVVVINGLFNVLLGNVNPIPSSIFTGTSLWLQTQVGTEKLSPRKQIVSVAYTFRAEVADHAYNATYADTSSYALCTKYADSAIVTSNVSIPLNLSGSVADPNAIISATNTGSGAGIAGFSSSGSYGVWGNSQSGAGVYGESSDDDGVRGYSVNGSGVYGKNVTSGNYGYIGNTNYGLYGRHNTSHNYGYIGSGDYGVYGRHNSSGNYGYMGSNHYGVYGKHYVSGNKGHIGDSAHGVFGSNNNGNYGYLGGSLYGVYGENYSSGNEGHIGGGSFGVYGRHSSGDYGYLGGSNRGVFGNSSSGIGVYGQSSSGTGVKGSSSSGTGVYGYSTSGTGVHGMSSNGNAGFFENTNSTNDWSTLYAKTNGPGWAIHAQSTHSSAHAGYFDGNVEVTGSLSVNGPAIGFFPRPAWDSGWISLNKGQSRTLTHNVGGNPDDYFVDFQFKGGGMGIHNHRIGGDRIKYLDQSITFYHNNYYGAYYRDLTSTQVTVKRHGDDEDCEQVRVRIWVIK